MVVYRITTSKWAGVLSGSGYPARWNSKGIEVIYTASTRALACLENLVHRSGEGLNHQFRITEIFIDDKLSSETIKPENLPSKWFKRENYGYTQSTGDQWVREKRSLLLQVPSSIIREEYNVLINPNHPEFSQVEIQQVTPFSFDDRL